MLPHFTSEALVSYRNTTQRHVPEEFDLKPTEIITLKVEMGRNEIRKIVTILSILYKQHSIDCPACLSFYVLFPKMFNGF